MKKNLSPLAGKIAPRAMLVNVQALVTAYYTERPDPHIQAQRVIFGTSGHRGSSFNVAFNEWHILAISQAICLYRKQHHIDGPLFLGIDTHALAIPACASAMEVLAANGVNLMIAKDDEFTPTPVISHAILTYNRGRKTGLADGIVITPSHNPPHDGGFKYNPPTGGPASLDVTTWIENKANALIEEQLKSVKRVSYETALHAKTTHRYDFLNHYVNDLGHIIDLESVKNSQIHLGVDPLGGAGVHYWEPIAAKYGLHLTVVRDVVDPQFGFMTVDWDGEIRMDPSSPYAMVNLLNLKDRFDISFGCDTDHDRHGVVTKKAGLLTPNHYLSVAISYLYQNRPQWDKNKAIGKTVVTTQLIDRIALDLKRKLYEVPVGFKWFVDGLMDGSLGFGGEESAGASFSRLNGDVWSSDKDGIILALLSAEIAAKTGEDLGDLYQNLENKFGHTFFLRINTHATYEEKNILKNLTPKDIDTKTLAGSPIQTILTEAPGNHAPIGGLKVVSQDGWFVARPSGTEQIYELYAESFKNDDHLQRILDEAQTLIHNVLKKHKEL